MVSLANATAIAVVRSAAIAVAVDASPTAGRMHYCRVPLDISKVLWPIVNLAKAERQRVR